MLNGKKDSQQCIGLDGTPQLVLKDMADMLVRLLSFLKNRCDDWTDVTPNFKKGQN